MDQYRGPLVSIIFIFFRLVLTNCTSKGLNHKPFKKPDRQATAVKYFNMASRMALMTIRRLVVGRKWTLPICYGENQTHEILSATKELESRALNRQETQKLMFSLLLDQSGNLTTNEAGHSPIRQFLLISSLRKDGTFEDPHLITPKIAALQFVIRLAAVDRVKVIHQEEPVSRPSGKFLSDLDCYHPIFEYVGGLLMD
jgi:hypothetical protein